MQSMEELLGLPSQWEKFGFMKREEAYVKKNILAFFGTIQHLVAGTKKAGPNDPALFRRKDSVIFS